MNSNCKWVTGIQGKREWKVGTGTCKNHYLSDSLPVKFTELCKPSHKYSVVVKFFLSHNKRQLAQNSISTDAIHDLLQRYNSLSLFNTHRTTLLIHSCFTIQVYNIELILNRCLWLECMINKAPTVLSLCYSTIGTQDQVITFLSNRVKDQRANLNC